MTERTLDDIRAGLRMSQAEQYLADLMAWRGGDSERFGRMILAGGEHSGASPQRWVRYIVAIAGEDYVLTRHSERLAEMMDWLISVGLMEARS